LLPLFLYAYIPLRAPRTPYANVRVGPDQALALYEPTFQSFLAYVVGQTFQGEIGTPAQAVARLGSTGRLLINEVSWVGVLLGIIGLGWLAWRSPRLLALTGLSFLAVVAFNLLYGIGDIFVFYIPAYLIWTLWMAAGVAGMRGNGQVGTWQMANRKWQRLQSAICNLQSVIRLLAFLLSIWLLVANFGHLDQSRNNQARAAWQALLAQPIPQAAILVTNDRDEMMSLWYLQYGEGVRPDLTGLFPLIRPEPEWADVAGVTAEALRSGRPVFLIKPMPGLAIKFSMEPAGALTRVRESATVNPPQQPADVIYADAIRLTGYDLRSATLVPGGSVSLTLYWQPLRRLDADYTTFVHLFNADGTRIAQSDHRPGDVYYPTSLWKPAETLADTHTLALPAEPGKPPYTILVGLYTGTTDLRHLGQPQVIGAVKP
jgi:hypothetical protein